jgi:hypothetical protein
MYYIILLYQKIHANSAKTKIFEELSEIAIKNSKKKFRKLRTNLNFFVFAERLGLYGLEIHYII